MSVVCTEMSRFQHFYVGSDDFQEWIKAAVVAHTAVLLSVIKHERDLETDSIDVCSVYFLRLK
jgi:hypothetical protein